MHIASASVSLRRCCGGGAYIVAVLGVDEGLEAGYTPILEAGYHPESTGGQHVLFFADHAWLRWARRLPQPPQVSLAQGCMSIQASSQQKGRGHLQIKHNSGDKSHVDKHVQGNSPCALR